MTDRLTLRGKKGIEVVLFAPREVPGGVEADAVMVSAPIPRPRTLSDDTNRRFRAPAVPHRGLFLTHVFFPEVK